MQTTKIWEKHFGQSPAVPVGPRIEPFFNELCDAIEANDAQTILDKAAFGLATPEDIKRLAALKESYKARNGREMVIVHKSRD